MISRSTDYETDKDASTIVIYAVPTNGVKFTPLFLLTKAPMGRLGRKHGKSEAKVSETSHFGGPLLPTLSIYVVLHSSRPARPAENGRRSRERVAA